jgi:epoxyqueuosine reductase
MAALIRLSLYLICEFSMTNGNPYRQIYSSLLAQAGLNMQAVFRVQDLSPDIVQSLQSDDDIHSGSVIMFGSGGTQFWQQLPPTESNQRDPLDQHAVAIVQQYLQASWPGVRYRIVYPGENPVGLQRLGALAGWHHESPLKLGINATFGLWYAYRAVVWVDREIPVTKAVDSVHPCADCAEKPCVRVCPADALSTSGTGINACFDYRLQHQSSCQFTCLSRLQCPVATSHRYLLPQIQYHYQHSFQTLVRWRGKS